MRAALTLETKDMKAISTAFLSEMKAGLEGRPSTIKMINSFVTVRPTGQEAGRFWVVDIGGSNMRIRYVDLQDGVATTAPDDDESVFKGSIPPELMVGSTAELYAWIAQVAKQVGMKDGDTVGFTFSFPCQQTSISSGTLIQWTKEWRVDDLVGSDVVQPLRAALAAEGLEGVNVAAMANDTVGTLVYADYAGDPHTEIGIILGTGTNAAYFERGELVKKLPAWQQCGEVAINMEWGGFGSTAGGLDLLRVSDWDRRVIRESEGGPQSQLFEKLISGKYQGEMVRNLVAELVARGDVFADQAAVAQEPFSFNSAQLYGCIKDAQNERRLYTEFTARLALGAQHTSAHDARVVEAVCRLVGKRAARLAGTAVASVAQHVNEAHGSDPGREVVASIDGSVFLHNRDFSGKGPGSGFDKWMVDAARELGVHTRLDSGEHGSSRGVAVIAAVAPAAAKLAKRRRAGLPDDA